MPINVSGPGNRQGNPDGGPLQPDPTGERAAVANAQQRAQQGAIAPGSMGTIGGEQYPSSGAAGVTKYGLFGGQNGMPSAPSSAAPPAPSTPPPMQVPGALPPANGPRLATPPAGGARVPTPTMTGVRGPSGQAAGQSAPASPPPTARPIAPPRLGMAQRIAQAPRMVGGVTHAALPAAATPRPAQAQPTQASPPPNMTAQGTGTASGFDNAGGGVSLTSITPDQQAQNDANANLPVANDYSTPGGIAQSFTNAAGQTAADVGGFAGSTFAAAKNAYDQASGGSNTQSFSDYYNQMAPGFQENSLSGAVGQNMQQMMDPAAWQQMAQNQLDARTAANTSSLNLAQRRLADSAGRSGLANAGGANADMLRNFANEQAGAQRDVYNDTLNNQMKAINTAGSYANSLRGQDVGMKNASDAIAAQGSSQDLANARADNPSFLQMLQGLTGGAGAAAGAGAQGLGALVSLLPLLAAA